jgi:hypothetical protein
VCCIPTGSLFFQIFSFWTSHTQINKGAQAYRENTLILEKVSTPNDYELYVIWSSFLVMLSEVNHYSFWNYLSDIF